MLFIVFNNCILKGLLNKRGNGIRVDDFAVKGVIKFGSLDKHRRCLNICYAKKVLMLGMRVPRNVCVNWILGR